MSDVRHGPTTNPATIPVTSCDARSARDPESERRGWPGLPGQRKRCRTRIGSRHGRFMRLQVSVDSRWLTFRRGASRADATLRATNAHSAVGLRVRAAQARGDRQAAGLWQETPVTQTRESLHRRLGDSDDGVLLRKDPTPQRRRVPSKSAKVECRHGEMPGEIQMEPDRGTGHRTASSAKRSATWGRHRGPNGSSCGAGIGPEWNLTGGRRRPQTGAEDEATQANLNPL